jgi:hypothetical protein
MTTYRWRQLSTEPARSYRRPPRLHALPEDHGVRDHALCKIKPPFNAIWIDAAAETRCRRCLNLTHVKRLVREI